MKHDAGAHQTEEEAPQTRGSVIRWARFYDLAGWLMSFGQKGRISRRTAELAAPAAGEKALDVGCGTGTLALMLREKVGPQGAVHGIDASREMIEVARGKAEKAKTDVELRIALIEKLPFPDGEFDLVTSSLMLHHLPDDLKREGLTEIRRVLKPGGRLLAVDLTGKPGSALGLVMRLVGHRLPEGYERQLVALMEEAGFEPVELLDSGTRQLAFILARRPS